MDGPQPYRRACLTHWVVLRYERRAFYRTEFPNLRSDP